MSEWVHSTVGAVTAYQRAGGTPTATNDSFYGGEIPFVTIEDITNSTRFVDRTEKYLSDSGLANSAAWLIKEPHILYSMYATVGKPIINQIACATNQAIIALKESPEIEQSFLFYQLLFMRPNVYKYTAQTTQSNLNAGSVKKLPISYPKDKREQRKIAAILSGIDTAIEKTEALIAKYQQIKAGLMHDLFTRGVLANGQLRPPREQAPELYQETAIGWIPREWQLIRLEQIAQVMRGKFTHRPRNDPAYLGGPYPFIQTSEITSAEGRVLHEFTQTLSALGITVSQSFPEGTIAITIAANIAETAILGMPMYFPDSVVGAIVDKACNLRYVELCIRQTKRRLDAAATQSAQKNINLQDLRPLPIPIPARDEQDRIAERIEAQQAKVDCEIRMCEKLSKQKLGLMQDLLTGKVPVKVGAGGTAMAHGEAV